MKNLSKLENMFTELVNKRSAVEAEISDLESRKAEIMRQASEAAAEGDTEKYKVCMADAKDVDTDLYVKNEHLKKIGTTCDEDLVKKNWAAYAAGYEKDEAARIERLEKARAELKAALIDVAEGQNEALKQREKCCMYIGMTLGTGEAEEAFPIKYVKNESNGLKYKLYGIDICNPDALYIISMDESCGPMLARVLQKHLPYKD